jgi:hypothetical protein
MGIWSRWKTQRFSTVALLWRDKSSGHIISITFIRLLPPGGIRRDGKVNYENTLTNTRHLSD